MRVWHGSWLKIEEIDLTMCEPRKDFGRGFYVTNLRQQAEVWAARKAREHHAGPIVTEFNFFESAFSDRDFKTLRFNGYNDDWLDFVALNRNLASPVPAHDYDIVEGPVADDKVATRITAYMRGDISREEFLREITHEKPSHQICFCTVKSLLMLERADFRGITAIERASENIVGQMIADHGLSDVEAADLFYNSDTYAHLADISTENYLHPWNEIYMMLRDELKI